MKLNINNIYNLKFYLKLLRPHQWVKNIFVFTGLIFANAWHSPDIVYAVFVAGAAFCLMSSAVYIYNDLIDIEQDKIHPVKQHRVIPSGKIKPIMAINSIVILIMASIFIGFLGSIQMVLILISYFVLNIAYSHYLKHKVILDVFAIALGFMLRILAGTVGAGIPPSQWLLFCGLMITLFLGFTKRQAEINITGNDLHFTRTVLKEYSHVFLDKMISITASCSILGYGLYTMNSKNHYLIYTLPLVIYGIFRYSYIINSEDIVKDLCNDKPLLITGIVWLVLTVVLI